MCIHVHVWMFCWMEIKYAVTIEWQRVVCNGHRHSNSHRHKHRHRHNHRHKLRHRKIQTKSLTQKILSPPSLSPMHTCARARANKQKDYSQTWNTQRHRPKKEKDSSSSLNSLRRGKGQASVAGCCSVLQCVEITLQQYAQAATIKRILHEIQDIFLIYFVKSHEESLYFLKHREESCL